MHQTRIFMNGASQAVRLPAECRFENPDVCVARIGEMVVIYPKAAAWSLFQSAIGSVGDDFKRPEHGEHERDLKSLDPTPVAVRARVYRKSRAAKGDAAKSPAKSAVKRARKSA